MTLKEARTAAGMTQRQLAAASGVHYMQISRAERGEIQVENMTAKTVFALADALGVEARALLESR